MARKDFQEAMMAFRRVVFALSSQMKVQARIISRTKGKGKFQKRKGKEETHPQSGHLKKKDIAMHGNLMTDVRVSGLMIFGLHLSSSPVEYSTMGHIVLDLTSLTYQLTTKSSNRSGHPKKQVIFAMSERNPAFPAQALDMREDEDED